MLKLLAPLAGATVRMPASGEPLSIVFVTDGAGPHVWTWLLAGLPGGEVTTAAHRWDAKSVLAGHGGSLIVSVTAHRAGERETARAVVDVRGTNPSPTVVDAYLASCAGSDGFERIVAQESRYLQFDPGGLPVRSFDGGIGLCQLTAPAATVAQTWSWRANIDAGLALFHQKRETAVAHLSQDGRTYTADQLRHEAICRWNGGAYHVWNTAGGWWERPANIQCDIRTGNIGWDMNSAHNDGKTAVQLRARDAATYKSGHGHGLWQYSGVCYADHVLRA